MFTLQGPFFQGRRHGVGIVTSLVRVTVDPTTVWDGVADTNWIQTWTEDKPEMKGDRLKVSGHIPLSLLRWDLVLQSARCARVAQR